MKKNIVKTTFNNLLANALLLMLEQATAPHRKKAKPAPAAEPAKPPRYTEDQIKEMKRHLSEGGLANNYTTGILNVIGIAVGAPELIVEIKSAPSSSRENKIHKTLAPFVVIKLANDSTSHRYPVNVPIIVTNAKGHALALDGLVENSTWREEKDDTISIASAEEVQACVAGLNDAQWQTIRAHALFAAVVKQAMDVEVLVPAK